MTSTTNFAITFFISGSQTVPWLSSLWSEFQNPHTEEQAGAKQMILWEQWTLFCAPRNKFPPPPAPQNKVPQWQSTGVDTSQQELLSRFGGFLFLSVLCLRLMMLSGGCTVRDCWIIWGKSGKKRATASLLFSAVYRIPAAHFSNLN